MKAILVPRDLNQPIREVEGPSIPKLAQEHWDHPGGKWCERVNTTTMYDAGFMMVVDDDGHDHQLGMNLRAMLIAQYPGGPLVGDVFLACEERGEFGIDFVDVKPEVMRWVEAAQIDMLAKVAVRTVHQNCGHDDH